MRTQNGQLTPKESASHILTMLREDVGGFPEHLTPKIPLPAIMHAERQRELLERFSEEAACDLKCLGTSDAELKALVEKAAVLRIRYQKRAQREQKHASQ